MKLPSRTEMALLQTLGPLRLNGRELAVRYKEETGHSISYGTLYTTMGRLSDKGWVVQVDSNDADGRLKFFSLTGKGVKILEEARNYFFNLYGLGEGKAI